MDSTRNMHPTGAHAARESMNRAREMLVGWYYLCCVSVRERARASEQASDIKRIEMITLSKAAARMQMPLL